MIYIQISENFLQNLTVSFISWFGASYLKYVRNWNQDDPFWGQSQTAQKKWDQKYLSKQIKKDLLDFNLICLCLNSFLQIKITYLLCKKLFYSSFQWNKNMCSKIFYQWWNMWESTLQKHKLVAKVIKDEEFAKNQAHQAPLIYHHNSLLIKNENALILYYYRLPYLDEKQ